MSYTTGSPASYTTTTKTPEARTTDSQDIHFASASPAADTPRLIANTGFEGQSPAAWNDEIADLILPLTGNLSSYETPPELVLAANRCKKDKEKSLREKLYKMEVIHGIDSFQALNEVKELVDVLMEQSRFNAAEVFARRRVLTYRRLYPEQDEYACAMADLSNLFMFQGYYGRSEKLARKACAVLSANNEDKCTIWCNTVLLHVLVDTEQWQEAEQLANWLLGLRSMTTSNPMFGRIAQRLARIFHYQGRLLEAHTWLISAYESTLKNFGPKHHKTIAAMRCIFANLQIQARFAEAEEMALEILSLCQRMYGPEHDLTASAYFSLGALYKDQGQWQRAESLLQASIIIRTKIFGPRHEDVCYSTRKILELYLEQQRWDEARSLLSDCQAFPRPDHNPLEPILLAMCEAEILNAQELCEQARSIGQAAAQLLETRGPLHVPRAMDIMTSILRNLGDLPGSEEFGSKAVDKSKAIYGVNHPRTARCMDNLARTWVAKGESEKAILTMKECIRIFTSVFGPEHYLTVRSRDKLMEWAEWQSAFDGMPILQTDLYPI